MARLIDADELIEIAHRIRLDSRERIERMIESAPTVDAEPITRCQDCVFWGTRLKGMHDGKPYGDCLNVEHTTRPTFYCAWGEREDKYE